MYIIETNPEASFPVGLDTHGARHLDVNTLASKLASIEVARKSEEEVSLLGNSPDDPLLGFGSPLHSVSRNSQAVATGKKSNYHTAENFRQIRILLKPAILLILEYMFCPCSKVPIGCI